MSFGKLDVATLLRAVENNNNSEFENLTREIIAQQKNNILGELCFNPDSLDYFKTTLRDYRYIDTLASLKYGSYVRWFDIRDASDVYLTPGGVVLTLEPNEDDVVVKCKNFTRKVFQFEFNKSIVFQKLSPQEQVILSAMEMLEK